MDTRCDAMVTVDEPGYAVQCHAIEWHDRMDADYRRSLPVATTPASQYDALGRSVIMSRPPFLPADRSPAREVLGLKACSDVLLRSGSKGGSTQRDRLKESKGKCVAAVMSWMRDVRKGWERSAGALRRGHPRRVRGG